MSEVIAERKASLHILVTPFPLVFEGKGRAVSLKNWKETKFW